MGIYIYLLVSKSVTQEEWEKAYQETLTLVEQASLAEYREEMVDGIKLVCLSPAKEREHASDQDQSTGRRNHAWYAGGDMKTLRIAEPFSLRRELVSDESYEACAGDALLGAIPAYTSFDRKDDRFNHVYRLWGNKTQGEPYHISLLSVACLLESRLKNKVFIYGDITKGQCKKAVKFANEILENKIDIPCRCYPEKLYEQIERQRFTASEKLEIFVSLYLGNHDKEFWKTVKKHFSEAEQKEYWRKVFADSRIDPSEFRHKIKEFLESGADLDWLCNILDFHDLNENKMYEKLIYLILDTKVYLEEKDFRDVLRVDQNEEKPYSVWTLVAQSYFAEARNVHVDRYIPIEELRETFSCAFSDKCDVNGIIDGYLEEAGGSTARLTESSTAEDIENASRVDAARAFNDIMDILQTRIQEQMENYDMCDYEDLLYYKKGDFVSPGLLEAIEKNFAYYDSFNLEKEYHKLMAKDAHRRCEWLAKQNKSIMIRKCDWEKIFDDIETNTDSFRRYYPMVKINITCDEIGDLIKAFIINDDIYALCEELHLPKL